MHPQPLPTSCSTSSPGGADPSAELDAMTLLANKRGGPLLTATGSAALDENGRLLLTPSKGRALLSGLEVRARERAWRGTGERAMHV